MRIFCLLLTLAAPAFADEEDADAYCRYARSVAASQDSLLFIPSLFLDYGVVNGNDITSGAGGLTAGPPLERLTVGARWSLMGIGRGIVDLKRAAADCERYRAASGLARFLVDNREQASPAALDARLAVLRQALPRAQEIVRSLRASVERAHATVEELQAAQLHLDELEGALVQSETMRAGLPAARSSLPPPQQLLDDHRRADADVTRWESRQRILSAFDLSVRGGYDRFFGQRDVNPGFVVLSLSVNPAVIYQPFAEAEAARARVRFVRAENDAVEQKAELLAARLRALLAAERRRLSELRVLVTDAEARLKLLDTIEGDKLRRFRESIWFDYVRLRAEDAFTRVHVAELAQSLGEK
jgi:hypothetical protein